MKYTIVWNENKTESVILSGEDRMKDAEHAAGMKCNISGGVSTIADKFNDVYEDDKRVIQDGLVPMQPTDEMINAGIDAYLESKEVWDKTKDMVINIWRSMAQEMNK